MQKRSQIEVYMHTEVGALQDGHTFDRASITMWLTEHDKSPITNEILWYTKLRPNLLIRDLIHHHGQNLKETIPDD